MYTKKKDDIIKAICEQAYEDAYNDIFDQMPLNEGRLEKYVDKYNAACYDKYFSNKTVAERRKDEYKKYCKKCKIKGKRPLDFESWKRQRKRKMIAIGATSIAATAAIPAARFIHNKKKD